MGKPEKPLRIFRFSDFSVGQLISFTRVFSEGDHQPFLELSEDTNPLHWDKSFSGESRYGRPIVPLHMLIAPFSRIAGVHFPGQPSLYLGHEVRALTPVYYGDQLTYSARLIQVNLAHRVLQLRVVILRGTEVVVEGSIRTKSTAEEWEITEKDALPGLARPAALVTGALGALGRAFAKDLANRGFDLVLLYRGATKPAERFREELLRQEYSTESKISVHLLSIDLARPVDRTKLSQLKLVNPPTLVVHTASPPPESELRRLVAVNYESLRDIVGHWLPQWLEQQEGLIINISSTATENPISGWEDYSAAKSMSENLVAGIKNRYDHVGISGVNVVLGRVLSDFLGVESTLDEPSLLPAEVSMRVLGQVIDGSNRGTLRVTSGNISAKTGAPFVGSKDLADESLISQPTPEGNREADLSRQLSEQVFAIVMKKLRLNSREAALAASLGSVPSWDSLSHIELILEIERFFHISFSSDTVASLTTVEKLIAAVLESKVDGAD